MIYLQTRLTAFYYYLAALFSAIVLGTALWMTGTIRQDITGPIIKLKKSLKTKQHGKSPTIKVEHHVGSSVGR
jgi:hypothetical protein